MVFFSVTLLAIIFLSIQCIPTHNASESLQNTFFYPNSSTSPNQNIVELPSKNSSITELSEHQNDENCGKPQPGQNFALFYLFCYRQRYPIQDIMSLYFGIGMKIKHNMEHIYRDGMSVVFKSTPKMFNRAAKSFGAYTMKTLVFPKLYAYGKSFVDSLAKLYVSLWRNELEQANNRFQSMTFDEKSKLWKRLTENKFDQYAVLVQERNKSGRIEAYKADGVYRVYGAYATHYKAINSEYEASVYFREDEEEEIRFRASDRQFLPRLSLPPSIAFPWPWSSELIKRRSSILIMKEYLEAFQRSFTTSEPNNGTSSNDTSSNTNDLAHQYLRYVHDMDPEPSGLNELRYLSDGGSLMSGNGASNRSKCLNEQLWSFHYATGIPDLTIYKVANASDAIFPNFTEFLATTCNNTTSFLQSLDIETANSSESDWNDENGDCPSNCAPTIPNYSLNRSIVYEASIPFYTYPFFRFSKKIEWRRSGVTIFTPNLMEYVLCQRFYQCANGNRVQRVLLIKEIIQDATLHELKGISSGIQASSTVWFSQEDRNSDEYADAILGFASNILENLTVKQPGDSSPTLGEALYRRMEAADSILHSDSYYTYSTEARASIQQYDIAPLTEFSEDELLNLIDFTQSITYKLSNEINAYVQRRRENSLYSLLLNATKHRQRYDTRKALTEIAMLSDHRAAGFLVYETNRLNVVYRDLRVPHPFHFIMRLLIRLHESQLLLLKESKRIVICGTLTEFNLSYVRCQRAH